MFSITPSPFNGDAVAASRGGGAGAVLVVEDEDALALLLARVLQRLGWRVLYAADGAQTRRMIAEHGAELALALVDCGLPDTSGAELCAEIRTALPGVPLLLTSGRDQTVLATALAKDGPAGFLAKPYVPAELEVRLQQLLAHAA